MTNTQTACHTLRKQDAINTPSDYRLCHGRLYRQLPECLYLPDSGVPVNRKPAIRVPEVQNPHQIL
jgi:hypothetical protein